MLIIWVICCELVTPNITIGGNLYMVLWRREQLFHDEEYIFNTTSKLKTRKFYEQPVKKIKKF